MAQAPEIDSSETKTNVDSTLKIFENIALICEDAKYQLEETNLNLEKDMEDLHSLAEHLKDVLQWNDLQNEFNRIKAMKPHEFYAINIEPFDYRREVEMKANYICQDINKFNETYIPLTNNYIMFFDTAKHTRYSKSMPVNLSSSVLITRFSMHVQDVVEIWTELKNRINFYQILTESPTIKIFESMMPLDDLKGIKESSDIIEFLYDAGMGNANEFRKLRTGIRKIYLIMRECVFPIQESVLKKLKYIKDRAYADHYRKVKEVDLEILDLRIEQHTRHSTLFVSNTLETCLSYEQTFIRLNAPEHMDSTEVDYDICLAKQITHFIREVNRQVWESGTAKHYIKTDIRQYLQRFESA